MKSDELSYVERTFKNKISNSVDKNIIYYEKRGLNARTESRYRDNNVDQQVAPAPQKKKTIYP